MDDNQRWRVSEPYAPHDQSSKRKCVRPNARKRFKGRVQVTKRMMGLLLLAMVGSGIKLGSVYAADSHEGAQSVSMIELIANPERFDGKDVIVIGYVHLDKPPLYEETSDTVYIAESDHRHHISKNGLFLNVPTDSQLRKSFQDDYAIIEGRFNKSHGHMGLWSGTISNIQRLEKWPKAVLGK